MKVSFHNQTNENVVKYKKTLKKVFKKIENKKTFEIIFLSNEQIKELNQIYRNIDEKTDVLSFSSELDHSLGDVFISLEQANQQANDYSHSIEREISFLAVHGYLHLLGYDHQTDEEELEMMNLTNEILKEANLERMI